MGAGVTALMPGALAKFESVSNPVQISALSDIPFLANVALAPMVGAIAVSATSLVARFLRAESEIERHQLKWLAYAGVILAIAVVINQAEIAFRGGSEGGVTDVLVILGALSIPAAIGIAVLRYRLYDIDLIINRTLIYGPLTATLAGTYTASIIFFRLVFVDILGVSSDAAIASTTLMIAALFVPVRNRFQSLVDKLFKEDELKRLSAYSREAARIAELGSPQQVAKRFLALAIDATSATGCRIVVGPAGGEVSYEEGKSIEQAVATLPLTSDGVDLGRFELGPRKDGREYLESHLAIVQHGAMQIATSVLYDDQPQKRS